MVDVATEPMWARVYDTYGALDASSPDRNGTPGIQVFFDGHDDAGILDYTSKVAGFGAVDDIADADYAIIRVSARHGVYFGLDGGVPLSYRDSIKVYDHDTNMPSNVDSTAPGLPSAWERKQTMPPATRLRTPSMRIARPRAQTRS
jgi:hypothetical protein